MPTSATPPNQDENRRYAPAAERNQWPILEVLKRVLPETGLVLEIAAGTGQHAAFFSSRLPGLDWQPSDLDPDNLPSIRAWGEFEGSERWRPPISLDVTHEDWGVDSADAILCINMIHISPWAACEGLIQGASRLLSPGGHLITYGPYRVEGVVTAESNERFDRSLKMRNPDWGLRQLSAVEACANAHGIELIETVSMPANNLTVVFRKM